MNWLDSPGGHIVVSLLLIGGGMAAEYFTLNYGKELVVFGMGVLSRSMIGDPKLRQ